MGLLIGNEAVEKNGSYQFIGEHTWSTFTDPSFLADER